MNTSTGEKPNKNEQSGAKLDPLAARKAELIAKFKECPYTELHKEFEEEVMSGRHDERIEETRLRYIDTWVTAISTIKWDRTKRKGNFWKDVYYELYKSPEAKPITETFKSPEELDTKPSTNTNKEIALNLLNQIPRAERLEFLKDQAKQIEDEDEVIDELEEMVDDAKDRSNNPLSAVLLSLLEPELKKRKEAAK